MALRLITANVTIDGQQYSEEIQDFAYDPAPTATSVTDVTGKRHNLAGDSDWTLTLNVFQNFAVSGLARKMFDKEGDVVPVIIVDGPVTWKSDVTLVAPKIGGATKQVGISSLALASTKPVPTPTAAG